MKLTAAQRELLIRVHGAGCIECSQTPGRENEPRRWWVMKPYSSEDGRTCEALVRRGLLVNAGGPFELSDAGRAAIGMCRYACAAFPNCGCTVEALSPPAAA